MALRWRILGEEWKETESGIPLEKLMYRLNLSPEEYVPSVNGKVVPLDYVPKDGDEITFIPVVSGG